MAINVLGIPADSPQGTKIMVHNLAMPVSNNTTLVDVSNIINIPQPILRYYGNDDLMMYTAGYSTEWLQYQPMAFLFRYKNTRSKRDKSTAWVHPVDIDGPTRWAGFGIYNGTRNDSNGNPYPGLTTEVELPNTYNGRDGFKFPFNRFMFWRSENGIDVLPNGLQGSDWNVFNINNSDSEGRIIGTSNLHNSISTRKLRRKKKIQKFRIAFGIRNPNVDSTTGQSPMIFGPMSDVIFTMPGIQTGQPGIGSYLGINEIDRLAELNSLDKVYVDTPSNLSNGIYDANKAANDIIVRIASERTY
ncbi:MAG: hypothetical protein MUF68_06775 [Cyclobacteriaceae bacterium]|jgi:hypothetical protein|nr:hypothetical protein [Cyclobacteriaceae bacterium]